MEKQVVLHFGEKISDPALYVQLKEVNKKSNDILIKLGDKWTHVGINSKTKQYDKSKNNIVNEIHLYTDSSYFPGQDTLSEITLNIKDIEHMEVYDQDEIKTKAAFGSDIAITLAIINLMAIFVLMF